MFESSKVRTLCILRRLRLKIQEQQLRIRLISIKVRLERRINEKIEDRRNYQDTWIRKLAKYSAIFTMSSVSLIVRVFVLNSCLSSCSGNYPSP